MIGFLKIIIRRLLGAERYEYCQYLKRKIHFSSKFQKLYCPCCNSYIKEWYSFREKQWANSYNEDIFEEVNDKCACPVCNSTPRHRIEATWLNNYMLRNKDILLWAPEYSMKIYLNLKKAKVITSDMYEKNVMRRENIEETTFHDKKFDFIICNHVLEHVSDVNKALGDTLRILKEDGYALITVPQNLNLDITLEDKSIKNADERKIIYGQSDHLRLFGNDFTKILENAGFKVEEYNGEIFCNKEILPIVAPARYDSNILYICSKDKCTVC